MKLKLILSLMMLIVFQFETVFGDDTRPVSDVKPRLDVAAAVTLKKEPLNYEALQKKIIAGLKKNFNSEEYLKTLGPGVTGGGDSCEQKIAYSFSFLARLVANGQVSLEKHGVQNPVLSQKIENAQLHFGANLQVDRPVEMINVPADNLILLDRKICENSFEPLHYYTPLLLHEVLRLVGIEEGRDYAISTGFIPVIQKEIRKSLNQGRRFRILSRASSDRLALGWGVKGALVDFEAMDEKSHDEQVKFFTENKIENYLIDLKTMQILAVIRDGSADDNSVMSRPVAEFSSGIGMNHNSLGLKFDEQSGIGMTTGYAKWTGGIETLFAVKENAVGQKEVIGFCDNNCEAAVILPKMFAHMTPEQVREFARGANNAYYELSKDSSGRVLWKINITSEVPKGDEFVSYSGLMRLTFADGTFKAVIEKVVKDKTR